MCVATWMGFACEVMYGWLFLCVYIFEFKNTIYKEICIPNSTWLFMYHQSLFETDRVWNWHLHYIKCLFLCALRCVWWSVHSWMYCKLLSWLDWCVLQRCMQYIWIKLHVHEFLFSTMLECWFYYICLEQRSVSVLYFLLCPL